MEKQQKLLWLFSLGIAVGGISMLYAKISSRLTAIVKKTRQIVACRINSCSMLAGNTVKFNVPLYNLAFYKGAEVSQVSAKLNVIKQQYGNLISSISTLTNLPETLLRGFVFIESGGVATITGGKSIGLMQIDPVTAHGMIWLEHKKGRLSDAERNVLRKYLGVRLDALCKDKWMNQTQRVTAADLRNPEFNLLVGAIYLGILVDEHTEGSVLRLDKIVSRYNRGYFSKSGLTGDAITVYNNQPSITKSYILKLAGKDGVLDILT